MDNLSLSVEESDLGRGLIHIIHHVKMRTQYPDSGPARMYRKRRIAPGPHIEGSLPIEDDLALAAVKSRSIPQARPITQPHQAAIGQPPVEGLRQPAAVQANPAAVILGEHGLVMTGLQGFWRMIRR